MIGLFKIFNDKYVGYIFWVIISTKYLTEKNEKNK
jgi:hypothetical protein